MKQEGEKRESARKQSKGDREEGVRRGEKRVGLR